MKKLIIFCLAIVALTACEYLEPRPIQHLSTDELLETAQYGEGLLTRAYNDLNTTWDINSEYLTDNAVPSTAGTNVLALGGWTLDANPIGDWEGWYNNIRYLNYFIENCQDLVYSVSDPVRNETLQKNRIGEAYFLRAWYQWNLLKTYGGVADGEALGYPIVTKVLAPDDDLDLPRNSYEDCVAQIVSDLDEAISILPFNYNNGSDTYTGVSNRGRGSGSAAIALKAKVYLYAASPAFGNSTQVAWVRAAQEAYNAIEAMGGLTSLAAYGNFNTATNFDYIWIQPALSNSNGLERSYYPPSLYGSGGCNPSQNLVDVFPAADGYPIASSTIYDEDDPYYNRDPRFNRFIFFNGDNYNGNYIRSYVGGADAPGGLSQQGTRTGYYLKKLLSFNVRLTPGDVTTDMKFLVYLSKTDLYLTFAEAANEAYGPDDATLGFSAADALGMVRARAGIDSDPATGGYQDQYLTDQVTAGKDAFRTLVNNERRVELCFEGDRFWDIRRLNEPLDHTIKGVSLTVSGNGPIRPDANIALISTPSADFVSPYSNISRINDGSTSSSRSFHNWPSTGLWRYVQLDFPQGYMQVPGTSNVYKLSTSTIRWFNPDAGVLYPDSAYIEIWDLDLDQWVEVWTKNTAVIQYDYPDLGYVNTDKIRLHFKSNTASSGLREWWVYGTPAFPVGYSYVYGDVESHTYQDFMRFVPLPYEQTLLMRNLKQNSGW